MLDVLPPTSNDSYLILQEEVEAAAKSLNKGKSAGVDNIPSKLVQEGGEAVIDMLLISCNKIWQIGEWPSPWTQFLIITLPKKGNPQLCQNYRTISLISHPSSHAKNPPELTETTSGGHHQRITGRLQSRKEHNWANFQYSVRNTCNTSKAFALSL